ncbi:WlaTC/HtrL family glycosyltransferase [Pseudohongiella spirulinae]|uniref:Glycosyl transferase n=1 Tax=Pseudohongiella spirulinae TaxID=1249552 RepID=A0A0S2KEJ9_9GAMM|nr:WlaTC/HtrL family glycosyltransferase [Pseudohongiella spirulinae]ALO46399.1 hypothetical protein PS2015_1748 [Pseudohongiella spirulinae]
MHQPTLVTALLDINRSQINPRFRRKWHAYERSLKRLCQLDLPFHIHAAPAMHAKILRWRQGRQTRLYALNHEQLRQSPHFESIQRIRTSGAWLSQAEWLTNSPMATLELYVPLVNSKMRWLAQAAEQSNDNNDNFIWIDAGIHMHLYPGEHQLVNEAFFQQFIREPSKLRMLAKPYEKNTEVHGFDRGALANYCQTDFVDRCCKGGIFGGGSSIVQTMAEHFSQLLGETIAAGHLGTEECILTALSYRYPTQTDTTLIQQAGVKGLFSERTPWHSVRRLRHPKTTFRALKRRVLSQWTAWRHNAQLKRILQEPPLTGLGRDEFDLHILLCARDVVNGLWALNSFLRYSELRPRLIIHDDGSLSQEHQQRLLQHFPEARIIPFEQANQDMSAALANYPNAYRYRITEYSWPAIKLLDFAWYSRERAFMVLDADVLFFKKPKEIIEAIRQNKGFYMSDWQDAYTWPLERWPAVLGTRGISKVNVGLFYLPDGGLYDIGFVEQCLGAYYQRQPCPRLVWLEQTVWAALFATLGETMKRLPDTYQISTKQALSARTCSHHYVNDSHLARLDFLGQGVPHLIRNRFLSAGAA